MSELRLGVPRPRRERRTSLSGRRIVVLLGNLELGGAERQAVHLATHLRNVERAHVQVFGFSNPGGGAARLLEAAGIPVRLVRLGFGRTRLTRWPVAIARLARSLREARCEAILPYCADANVPAGLAFRAGGARTSVWNQRDEGIGLAGGRWERLAVRLTPAFVSNSGAGADLLVRRYGVDAHRIEIVPNGVRLAPAATSRAEFRERLGIAGSTLVACMVGTVSDVKDHATLLRAWAVASSRLRTVGRNSILLLAGRDTGAAPARALAGELGLTDGVRFLGEVRDVAGLLGASDLAVFSSRSEGCPNAVLESMAAGLAVVATDIAGVRETLGENAACLAAPGDADAFAERIVALAEDSEHRSRLARSNRQRAETEFSVEAMCRRTAAVVARALAAGATVAERRDRAATGTA